MKINEILLENVRSFYGKYYFRITPITLLTGENSTGKTSILATFAALAQGAPFPFKPNFNESPFNLGLFDDIVTKRGGSAGRKKYFRIGSSGKMNNNPYSAIGEFTEGGRKPVLKKFDCISKKFFLSLSQIKEDKYRAELIYHESFINLYKNITLENVAPPKRIKAVKKITVDLGIKEEYLEERGLDYILLNIFAAEEDRSGKSKKRRFYGLDKTFIKLGGFEFRLRRWPNKIENIFHIAPIRAKPERIYEAYKEFRSAEGNHIPFVLEVASRKGWENLLGAINDFGSKSGLYSLVNVKRFGKSEGAIFKIGIKVNGPERNIVDVGYGVSQVLPIIVESLRAPNGSYITLQQPEVHLHPKAQAALGSFFANLSVTQRKTFLIETHSDFIVNRIRMESAKKGAGNLKPEDISIVFTELEGNITKVHRLHLDKDGKIVGQPKSYREFFMKETYDLLSK